MGLNFTDLDFTPVTLDEAERFYSYWERTPQRSIDYSLVNLWGWQQHYGLEWCFDDNVCWIRQTAPCGLAFWAPVGDWTKMDWAGVLESGTTFIRVPEQLEALLCEQLGERVTSVPARGQWEYVYAREDLAKLSGNRFHKKKNHVRGYAKAYGEPDYRPLDDRMVEDCLALQDIWCQWHDCEGSPSLDAENDAINRVLAHYDKFRNRGKVDLTVNHTHFKNFDYHVHVQADNMLMYDVPEKHNPMVYGTVYGSGTAGINGNSQVINIDVNMQSRPKTHVYLDFMRNSTAAEYDFITFVDRKKLADEIAKEDNHAVRDSIANEILSTGDDGAEMRMNFLLDITPDADIELVMDPNAGDRIKGHGAGSLQIQYGNRSDLRMYGNFTIQDGSYNFSLQQLIRKEFQIREGSMISFNGDPFNAVMDINAIYNVTANLSDLDQSLALESPRTSVPVNCVLMLNGMLRQPSISFDLELPGSNEELEQQMKSLIDTDDMMTRQIIYLLVLNKFYTPEYYAGTTSASGEFTAVASSTLSAQLSSLLNSITDKVQIGTNIRAGQDWALEGTEVEMLLSSQLLNNRLLLNGNFGYKNNATQKQVFIGEFDLEYKLTRSGDIRLKAYNHANDMYQYLKQSLTTQGVGIMFKKDFTRFGDLFRRRPRLTPLVSAPDTTRTEMPK